MASNSIRMKSPTTLFGVVTMCSNRANQKWLNGPPHTNPVIATWRVLRKSWTGGDLFSPPMGVVGSASLNILALSRRWQMASDAAMMEALVSAFVNRGCDLRHVRYKVQGLVVVKAREATGSSHASPISKEIAANKKCFGFVIEMKWNEFKSSSLRRNEWKCFWVCWNLRQSSYWKEGPMGWFRFCLKVFHHPSWATYRRVVVDC